MYCKCVVKEETWFGDLPPTRSLIALLRGISVKGFFNFCAMRDLRISTAETGASATAAAGPEFAGGGGAAAAGAEAGVEEGTEGVDAGIPLVAGVAGSSSTGSTS